MRIITYIILACILLTSVSAYTITTFTDGSSSGNLTYTTGTESPTRTLQLPSNIILTNAILYLNGYNTTGTASVIFATGNNVTTYSGVGYILPGYAEPLNFLFTLNRTNNKNWSDSLEMYNSGGCADPVANGVYRVNFSIPSLSVTEENYYAKVTYKLRQVNVPAYCEVRTYVYCINKSSGGQIGITSYVDTGFVATNFTNVLPSACVRSDTNNTVELLFDMYSGHVVHIINLHDVEMNITPKYPYNVTLKTNNQTEAFNYGAANGSDLDHQVLANITSSFNYSPITLWNLSFLSNTSGILEYSNLSVSYNSSVNVTFLTESLHELFRGNMTLDVSSTDNPLQKFYTTTGYVNLEHFNATFPLVLEYYDNKSEQPHRYYYVDPEESLNVTLFVENTTNLTNVLFTLYDEIGNPLSGYYVALQRKYDVDGNYYTVAMHKTDFNGQSLLNAVLYTTLYRFVVYDEDLNLVYQSSETEIKSTSITLTLNLGEDIWYGLNNAYGVEVTQIVYNNNTGQFTVSYNDANHVLNYTTFTVVQRTAFGDLSICSNTSTDTTKTYYCTILNPNISGYYTARLWGETLSNHSNFILAQGEYQSTNTPDKMGRAGVFMALLVFILLITFGLYNPAVAIMMACLGLIVVVALKLIFVSIGLLVVIIILGGILLFKMRT